MSLSEIEPGPIEGSISGGMTSNGYNAIFEWASPTDRNCIQPEIEATRHFPYKLARRPYLQAGIITVYTHPSMHGLPYSIDQIPSELLLSGQENVSLQNYIGKAALVLLQDSVIQNSVLHQQPIELTPQESRLMSIREATERRKRVWYP